MPAKSRQQAKLMFAAAAGDVKGVPKKVGKEFTDAFRGKPGSVKKLPKKVSRGKG